MNKQSQMEWVKLQFIRHGKVTRNQALRRYISRLSARILDLRQEGWEIEGMTIRTKLGRDYLYKLVK